MIDSVAKPRYVTVKEAMAFARCGTTKLYELMGAGKIKAKKDGGKTLIDLTSIVAYQATLSDAVIKTATRRNHRRGRK